MLGKAGAGGLHLLGDEAGVPGKLGAGGASLQHDAVGC